MNAASAPPPYLAPSSPAYRLAAALYAGEPFGAACRRLGIKAATGHSMRSRLRQRASEHMGREVNEVMALRLVFERADRIAAHDEVVRMVIEGTQ